MQWVRGRVIIVAALAVVVAACGSPVEDSGDDDRSEGVVQVQVPGGGADQVVVDEADTVWILGGEDRVLVARDHQGRTYERALGDAGQVADALTETPGGGVVYGFVACAPEDGGPSEACEKARLVTRTLALEDGDIVENEWKAPAPVLDPTAVTVGASVDGPLTFTSGATVVSEAGSITLDHAERSTVCATSDGLYAFRTVEGDAAGTPDLDSVDLASPIPAALDRLVDGRWEPVSGSETTYRQDDSWSVDTSCGSRGPEIRAASSPALQWWDGDTWVAGTEEGVAWWLWSDDPPIELEPTIGRSSMTGIDRSGRLVAQSLADGEITMTAELPAGVGRFWETTEGAPPTGSFATNGKVAVVCRADASSDRPCDIWRVQ